MKQQDFVKQRQAQWNELEAELNQAQCQGDFPKRYRQLCQDLAVAKARHYSPVLIDYLNQLLLAGQRQLYKPATRIVTPLLDFFKVQLPSQLPALRSYLIWAHVLFYGVALLVFCIAIAYPDAIRHVISNAQVLNIEFMYDPNSDHYAKERDSAGDFEMFGYYILNNISIAFQCFVGGLLLGFGTLFFLLFNAIYFGVISGHIVNIGYHATFFSFVITHGAFELTAIVMSAAAGMLIGAKLIRPGRTSRISAVRQAASHSFPIVFAAFMFLVIAAFIEAFWSSSRYIPEAVKYTVGALCWCWVLYYIFRHANR